MGDCTQANACLKVKINDQYSKCTCTEFYTRGNLPLLYRRHLRLFVAIMYSVSCVAALFIDNVASCYCDQKAFRCTLSLDHVNWFPRGLGNVNSDTHTQQQFFFKSTCKTRIDLLDSITMSPIHNAKDLYISKPCPIKQI